MMARSVFDQFLGDASFIVVFLLNKNLLSTSSMCACGNTTVEPYWQHVRPWQYKVQIARPREMNSAIHNPMSGPPHPF